MTDSLSPVPVFHANTVTIHVNADQVSIEFREILEPHAELWKRSESGKKLLPPPTEADLYKVEPVAKVVLTFVGAKILQANLNNLLPQVEEWRKQGVPK